MNLGKSGKRGEDIAVKFLKKSGYSILQRNFSCRFGEIDIVALKDLYIVFVEVKTRGERSLYSPIEAVTYDKQRKILKTAEVFLSRQSKNNLQPRFDVIEISLSDNEMNEKIKHTENAFCI